MLMIDWLYRIISYLILQNWKHCHVADCKRFWFSPYFLKYHFSHLENITFLYGMVKLTACSSHVTNVFQSESALRSCLHVKELLARSRRKIWSLSDCNWTRSQNHLVHKLTFNHLTKLASSSSRCISVYQGV